MRTAPLALLVLLATAAPAQQPAVQQKTGTATDGTRYYEDSLVIHAPAHRLFQAFTDATTYKGWSGVPIAAIDFRVDGAVEAAYDPGGRIGDPQNVKNALVAYVPDRLLAYRNVQAPDALPGKADYPRTAKTLEFDAIDATTTRVTVSGVGFGTGDGFDKLYAFFSGGDAAMLVQLKTAMEKP